MKKIFSTAILTLFCAMLSLTVQAQEMADTLRSNGKIYVVIVVLATIFAGLFAYLIYLDKKVSRIEKRNP